MLKKMSLKLAPIMHYGNMKATRCRKCDKNIFNVNSKKLHVYVSYRLPAVIIKISCLYEQNNSVGLLTIGVGVFVVLFGGKNHNHNRNLWTDREKL